MKLFQPKSQLQLQLQQQEEIVEMIIDCYHHFHEQKLIHLSTIEFPEKNTCFETLFFLISRNTCIHPGYASVMGMYVFC
jgi:hypothetical protein